MEEILIEGRWQTASGSESFRAQNPTTGEWIAREFPISSWADCNRALTASIEAARKLRSVSTESIAAFLSSYAANIEARAEELAAIAHAETALPVTPRLLAVELPRTTTQLRQAAAAAREGSWMQAVIDTKANIRSHFAAIGPVVVFGPNNFPFAFNAVSGGDLAAALAAGNPVIAKAHPLHPGTSRALAECAVAALEASGLPLASVQMLYHLGNDDGLRLVADPRVGATSFTGSRGAGLRLKAAADAAGKPIYLEMSSLNPIVFLPGALAERVAKLVLETADSGLAASGQFCTSPNLLFMIDGPEAQTFVSGLTATYAERKPGPLLSEGGLQHLETRVGQLVAAGARVLTGASTAKEGAGFCYRNTVLQVAAEEFIERGEALQQEAFGNATTIVLARDLAELTRALHLLEGNLTGCIYSDTQGADDAYYEQITPQLRSRVGRLLNDKMPTGVALSPAMQHGGPYPATGHPGFTAVGIPRAMLRFAALQCYDNVREHRLPGVLRDQASNPEMWRQIDGKWVQG
jgi:alpha-ketoglutaric semialdehyde dehydrogenase